MPRWRTLNTIFPYDHPVLGIRSHDISAIVGLTRNACCVQLFTFKTEHPHWSVYDTRWSVWASQSAELLRVMGLRGSKLEGLTTRLLQGSSTKWTRWNGMTTTYNAFQRLLVKTGVGWEETGQQPWGYQDPLQHKGLRSSLKVCVKHFHINKKKSFKTVWLAYDDS